jgi:hypothetical protein
MHASGGALIARAKLITTSLQLGLASIGVASGNRPEATRKINLYPFITTAKENPENATFRVYVWLTYY